MVLQGTVLASQSDLKNQTNLENEFDWTTFDEESQGATFTQIKLTLRGYASNKPVGIKLLKFNSQVAPQAKAAIVTASPALPSLALEEDSEEESEPLPSLKEKSSNLLQERMAELKANLVKEAVSQSASPPVMAAPSKSNFIVNVANKEEFDPNYKEPVVEAPPKKVSSIAKPSSPAASPVPAPSSKPLANVIVSVSGIGPERAEIRRILGELGGTYSHEWPESPPKGATVVLLVDAPSDQWHDTPKHNAALAQGVPIVDKSWILACDKKKQNLAVGPYLAQFRTGEGKAAPAAPILAPPAKATGKGTIKSEGGSFATDKKAKGDEEEDEGPDEYEYGDFVVPDDADIEYYDDVGMDVDEEPYYHPHHAPATKHKTYTPPSIGKNVPAKVLLQPDELEASWETWKAVCAIQKARAQTSAPLPSTPAHHSKPPAPSEAAFGMDVDDAASDGTNPLGAEELADLHRDM